MVSPNMAINNQKGNYTTKCSHYNARQAGPRHGAADKILTVLGTYLAPIATVPELLTSFNVFAL